MVCCAVAVFWFFGSRLVLFMALMAQTVEMTEDIPALPAGVLPCDSPGMLMIGEC